MSSTPEIQSPSLPQAMLAEASAWIARLHGPERTEATVAGWRDWFGAHPDHKLAWEAVSDKWNKSHEIPVGLVNALALVRGPSHWTRFKPVITALAAAASVALACVALYLGKGVVTTAPGEQKTLNLPDGTRIELNTATRLVLKYDSVARVVELKAGEAYFSVAHERRPFVVRAGDHKVIAVGTSFTVRRDPSADDAVTVTLIEGKVALVPLSAENILPTMPLPDVTMLSAGERAKVHQNGSATVDSPPIDRITAWMGGQLVFDHTPLAEAIAELNRYGTIQLSVANPATGQIKVSGTFRIGDSVSFAHAAAETYNLDLVTKGDGELVLAPEQDGQAPRAQK